MKKVLFFTLAAVTFFSCSDKEPESSSSDITNAAPVPAAATDVPAAFKPQAAPAVVNTATPVPAPMPVTSGTTGLNPEHGKPGHRCDIAVGAPLNSAPKAAAPAGSLAGQPVQMPSPQTIVQKAAPTAVAAGMNPEHGQPGHRCDIKVGEPLSTPVKAPASTQAAAPANIAAPLQNVPVIPSSAQGSTAKLNPAHGQPGHKCEIAVGAPLN